MISRAVAGSQPGNRNEALVVWQAIFLVQLLSELLLEIMCPAVQCVLAGCGGLAGILVAGVLAGVLAGLGVLAGVLRWRSGGWRSGCQWLAF